MFNKIKTRIRNPKVVTAIASGILIILVNLGVIGQDMSENISKSVTTILGIGVAIGIFGNPESHV
jgi:uncharacterized membrane protein